MVVISQLHKRAQLQEKSGHGATIPRLRYVRLFQFKALIRLWEIYV